MLPNSLSALACVLGQDAQGEAQIQGFAIDSRQVKPGDLFFALKGARDGHDFLADAKRQGAVAAVVTQATDLLPALCVNDVETALTELARAFCREYSHPVLALTGSQGKTSTRGFIASILAVRAARSGHEILVTQGNYNNQLGVPLTASRLRPEHAFAVFELGASKVGDIDHIAAIVKPHISALLNARAAHLEGFGSRAGVVQGKGEIIDHTADDGVVVLNADEPAFQTWRERAKHRTVKTFGQHQADVVWMPITDQRVRLTFEDQRVEVTLPTLGVHFMENAAAAVAMCLAAGAERSDLIEGLESAVIEPGRMTPHQFGALRLIDDTYNASPEAVCAAIDWLATQAGIRLLILGHLAELGADAEAEMEAIGRYAKDAGIERLVAVGKAEPIAKGFGASADYVSDLDALEVDLAGRMEGVDVALVKGSRSAHMERVIDQVKRIQGEND